MGRPEKPVTECGGEIATFAEGLRGLRTEAGSPTYREMARAALFSPSVLSSAASGYRLPTLRVTLAFVAACHGDVAGWERRWRTVSATLDSTVPPSGARARRTHRVIAHPAVATPGSGVHAWPATPAQLPRRPRGFAARGGAGTDVRPDPGQAALPLVITGPVGVGKTDFALRLAHEIAEGMPDGHLYANLDAPDPSSPTVLRDILQALCVGDRIPDTPGHQAGMYRSLLRKRRLVIMLDNVHDESQVRPLLAETPRGMMIVVSRNPLLGLRDVRRMELGVLARDASVAMIEALVGTRARADRDACERLAAACGDLPLALDVASRKLAARPHWGVGDVVTHVADKGRLLDWLQIGDVRVTDRLQSAYRGLTLPARTLLKQVGRSTAVTFTVRDVAGPFGVGPARADELLEELAVSGMVRREAAPGTYRLDALSRSFVAEQPVVSIGRAPIRRVEPRYRRNDGVVKVLARRS